MLSTIDCLGYFCPLPSIKAKIAYKDINPKDSIKIITDHSCAAENIKEAFKKESCIIEIDEVQNGIWEIKITKV